MTDGAIDERKKLFSELKSELLKRQLSNSDNFDKAILAYSTAGLGVSLAFLKDFIPFSKAAYGWLLHLSWTAFLVAVIATIVSFISSQLGIAKQLKLSERYYLEFDESAIIERNFFARLTDWLAYLSGIAFIAAVICTTLFVSTNLERAAIMAEEKNAPLRKGSPVPEIQPVAPNSGKFGAPVPNIQKVPQQQQPAQNSTTTPSSGGIGGPTKGGT